MNKNLEWYKYDLHHHTFDDKDNNRKEKLKDYEKIIDEFYKQDGRLIAITNHDKITTNSIEKYMEYIEKKKYYIQVLPGVELTFTVNEKKEKTDIILIFNNYNKEKCNKINSILKKEYEHSKNISECLKNILEEFKKEKMKLIMFPHFGKGGNKNLNYEKFGKKDKENFFKTIVSFDFLEGKYVNQKETSKKGFDYAIDCIKKGTGVGFGKVFGTDAHNLQKFQENLKKVPWFYTKIDFEGLVKATKFYKTRILLIEKKPYTIKKYIKKIKYNDKIIHLEKGLNSIIGRRGSGKSYFVGEIIKSIESEENNKNKTFEIISSTSEKITQADILYIKQNKLSQTIDDYNKEIYKNDDHKLDIEKTGITKSMLDPKDFKNNINDFNKLIADKLNIYEKNCTNKDMVKKTKEFEDIKKNIISSLNSDNKEKNEIFQLLEKDAKIIKEFKFEKGSKWLKNKMKKIQAKIQKLINNTSMTNTKNIEEIKNQIESKKIGFKHEKSSEEKNLESETINSKTDFRNALKKINQDLLNANNFINEIFKKYNEYKNWTRIKELHKENGIKIEKQIKIKKNIKKDKFLCSILQIWFNNISKQYKIKYYDFLKLELRQINHKIDKLFETNQIFWLNDKKINDMSLGQKQEAFIKRIFEEKKESEIIILDQPDDNLDSITIKKEIMSKIEKWNVSKQIIVVTHDPKIIINCDSKNIILANHNGDKEFGSEDYENIPFERIKENVHEIIDGQKDWPYIRYKEYGGYDDNR